MMMRDVLFASVVVGVVTAAAAGGGAMWASQQLQSPYQGFEGDERFVEIPMGASTAAIGRQLADAGVVRDEWILRAAVWWSGRARALQAGEYRFEGAATPFEVVTRIAEGRVFGRPLTFPEGLTLTEMAEIFEMRGFGPAKAFLTAARNVKRVSDLDAEARDLEGYLFPATYALSRTATAEEVVAMMVERFRSVWAEVSDGRDLGRHDRTRGDGAGVAGRKGDCRSGGAAGGRRGLSQPARAPHGAAGRPHGGLCTEQGGPVQRQHPQGRSRHQLAVQHLPLPGPAPRSHRRARPGRHRGRPRACRRCRISTSSAATTARTCSPRP